MISSGDDETRKPRQLPPLCFGDTGLRVLDVIDLVMMEQAKEKVHASAAMSGRELLLYYGGDTTH